MSWVGPDPGVVGPESPTFRECEMEQSLGKEWNGSLTLTPSGGQEGSLALLSDALPATLLGFVLQLLPPFHLRPPLTSHPRARAHGVGDPGLL